MVRGYRTEKFVFRIALVIISARMVFKILRVFNIVDFCGASGREVERIERTEAGVSQLGEQK